MNSMVEAGVVAAMKDDPLLALVRQASADTKASRCISYHIHVTVLMSRFGVR